ncbi:MAG TPA: type IV pilus secretin PilQ [Vicinamibacterales bacterium]|jgi:type IV pilus assembly protein PilQ|nr:type IV pilus secretin PilQ [Vicinamibacterales bacterium]
MERYRYSLLLVVCAFVALSAKSPVGAAGAGVDTAALKRITTRLDARTGVVAIEASDPVPYVASQPDPKTFIVELRDVVAAAITHPVQADPRNPFAAVAVENAVAADGARVARVQLTLSAAVRPRVRSSRNIIFVEADRLDTDAPSAGTVAAIGPTTTIKDIQVQPRDGAMAVTLRATGPIVPADVYVPKDGPRRLVMNLANVSSAVVSPVIAGKEPVQRVRVGLSPNSPLITEVSMELSRAAAHRIETSADKSELTVVFESPLTATAPARKPAPATPVLQQAAVPPAAQGPTPVPPAAQAAGQSASAQGVPQNQARYTGHPVSLDFSGADLRSVLRTFAEISGLNIVIDPTIQGTVDVSLRDVPWDQALDIILRANRLGYSVDGTIVRIAPLTVLADEESQRRKLSDEQALAGELRVMTRALSYARAEDLRTLITATALSQRGSIQTDARTNTMIINDLPERLERAAALLTTLDVPQPQVEIEARIVQTNRSFANSLGVSWSARGAATPALGNSLPLAFPNSGAANAGVNLPATGAVSSTASLALGSINGALNLDVALSALERNGQGRILSTPRVSTQNNIEAEITQGIQIPIQTIANNTVTVSFRDAALTLKVTPQITAAGTVIMRINVANESPDFSRSVNGIPPIDTQRAATQVLVSDGETTVIGGIYVSREQTTQDRTPALYRLPLLGWLFKKSTVEDESRELLIFLTPKIVKLQGA